MFKIEPTKKFQKQLKKLSREEQLLVAKTLLKLSIDPFQNSLRTKHYKRKEDVFECSVNINIRILWQYKKEKIIVTLEVGHHDIL